MTPPHRASERGLELRETDGPGCHCELGVAALVLTTFRQEPQPKSAGSASRTTLYIGAVSSTLVALGFIGQVSEVGDAFDVFALTVLPTLYLLGAFRFIRVVGCGAEDFRSPAMIHRLGRSPRS